MRFYGAEEYNNIELGNMRFYGAEYNNIELGNMRFYGAEYNNIELGIRLVQYCCTLLNKTSY
jgi:hypothetical protein